MSYTFESPDLEILNLFIEEAVESSNQVEKEILKLETNADKSELINDVFRAIHSIKGGSSFLGLVGITKLSHSMETALDSLRKERIEISTEFVDCFIEGLDLLSSFIYDIQDKVNIINSEGIDGKFEIELKDEDKVEEILVKVQNIICNEEKKIGEETKDNKNQDEFFFEIDPKVLGEFKEQFITESLEHIERVENDYLVKLDKNENDVSTINDLFRSFHSIKGVTGVLLGVLKEDNHCLDSAKDISLVSHSFETLLTIIRDRNLNFKKENIDLSYEVVDYLKACISVISGISEVVIPAQAIREKINKEIESLSNDLLYSVKECSEKKNIKINNESNSDVNDEVLKEALKKETQLQSIRVNQEKLDKMMNTIAELMVTKNAFMHVAKRLSLEYDIPDLAKEVKEIGASVNRISDELQNSMMSMRMVEVKTVFQKMPRIIRDVSQITNKKVNLIIEGESTEIDKTIIERISDPLVHIIRNAVDHGIEEPETRIKEGKNEIGTIYLRAYNNNKNVYIEVQDDGKGIDSEEIRKKVIDKGFIEPSVLNNMDKKQILNLIFLPGFSTAKKITEVSGRGVGMDIVRSNINKINGIVDIDSEVNKGTKMTIQLPLTLAVSRGLLVKSVEENYIIPIDNIIETVKIPKDNVYEFNNKHFAHLRGEIIGIEWLSKFLLIDRLENNTSKAEELNIVTITNGVEKLGLVVDKLLNEQEFVIKALSDSLGEIPGISGSTLLGDGKVVLILNSGDIIKMARM
ncbi:chemotaxis protein CheA [Clostridium beijerinckii]|uniref:Chemotaxis protein CheA n=1 Tax=Clostridium beijerinckii TaxID=1520 RepID=A0A9Q5GIS9_CLOBE|nr:chemotaxis protein CheA [Clostridium beijerinckii]AQS07041.1 chemotaxis protein CheA [Clostridium beijerinckii]MBA2883537.1 two-component system chemotaxis sensor kinase CheA [Clostridium beijerinckii]MBA2898724.1 two-component system chemotaxis sensor kinase CheA [Clostridium beijerinckii]MBA2908124.1 two-component system chemotaxis sensor kinase CheA [Clostridium beijerinckii]MBA9013328.1 two-component system chemotaxis sensor kinase CheA [Clostridium beijerinckii]